MPSRILPCGAAAAISAIAFAIPAASQQPLLRLQQRDFSQQQPSASLLWNAYGTVGNVYVLLADVAAAQTNVLGAPFDLAFSPSVLAVSAGLLSPNGAGGFVPFVASALPAGAPVFLQFGAWDPAAGFATLRASNVDSFATFAQPTAIVVPFDSLIFGQQMTGVFDTTVANRLQALPPITRSVRPLPPSAFLLPVQAPFEPLHPAGSRFQMAFRAADLGADGVPETLTAVRWRPLFGAVAAQTHPQFELLAAHCTAVPDYTIDPFTALPVAPASGLSTQFANNPAGASTTLFSGAYAVAPASLLPSGYMPFPAPQSFVYDGERTLLLETRCSPAPGLGTPLNHGVIYQLVSSSPDPFATVYASAGWNGQPSPLQPAATPAGTGSSFLFDWELEFRRTTSVATSPWLAGTGPQTDYGPPIVASFVPPGTSIGFEFRGALNAQGAGATAWSSSPDVADGKPLLQFRVTMTANAFTGAVPWIDTLIVPVQ